MNGAYIVGQICFWSVLLFVVLAIIYYVKKQRGKDIDGKEIK